MRKKLFFVLIVGLLAFGALNVLSAQAASCSDTLSDVQAQCYLARYTDLQAAFSSDLNAAKTHWQNSGCKEGRYYDCVGVRALSDAEAQCYLNRYSDLQAAFGASNLNAAKTHWQEFGYNEGRSYTCPSNSQNNTSARTLTDAEAQCYLNRYPDIVAVLGNSLSVAQYHWQTFGYIEGRDPSCPSSSSSSSPSSSSSSPSNTTTTVSPLTITTTSLPSGVVGENYVAFIDATGGNNTNYSLANYSWAITNLPDGLSKEPLRTLNNAIANVPGIYISGKPTKSGTFQVSLTVTSGSQTATKSLPLVIAYAVFCGNGVCDRGESYDTCSEDCAYNDSLFGLNSMPQSTACSADPKAWYLNRYPDIKANGGDALVHWCVFGKAENRDNCFTDADCATHSSSCWKSAWFAGGSVSVWSAILTACVAQ